MSDGYVHHDAHVEPGARLLGVVRVGARTTIGTWTEINARGCRIDIGDDCDIASFVSIHCADSSRRTLGLAPEIERLPIWIGDRVFIGQGAIILGGCSIGDGAIVGAGVVLQKRTVVPPGAKLRAAEPRGL